VIFALLTKTDFFGATTLPPFFGPCVAFPLVAIGAEAFLGLTVPCAIVAVVLQRRSVEVKQSSECGVVMEVWNFFLVQLQSRLGVTCDSGTLFKHNRHLFSKRSFDLKILHILEMKNCMR
jgi:hypothetical protein